MSSSTESQQQDDSKQQQQNQSAPEIRPPSIIFGPSSPVPLQMTFGQLLDYNAEVKGDRPAVMSMPQNSEVSWKQLRERSLKLAKAFAQEGIKKGDLVAISFGSRVEYFEIFFACTYVGAALVLCNYAYARREFVELLKKVSPKMIIAPPGFLHYDYTELLPVLAEELPSCQKFVLLKDIGGKFKMKSKLERSADYEEFLAAGDKAKVKLPDLSTFSPHDMVNVQFTSGSTGLPKNVSLSHYNIMNCGRYITQQTRMTEEDRVCLPVPLFHSFGMIVGISSSAVAGSALCLPHELFSSLKTLECIQKYKCTAVYGVPTMFVNEMAEKTFKDYDRSTIRFGIIAGAAMPPELLKRIINDYPMPHVYTCWGMTELSSFVTMMHETDPFEKRINTAGRLFPHFVAKVVKPNSGETVPWGEKGELVVSGYGQMAEYLYNDEKTKESLQQHQEDLQPGGVGGLGDGSKLRVWMHTGDEGYLDPEGYFVISGRIKDLVIRGGENISPMEIEERLVKHDAIAQASVIGVPDEKYGEELGAFVELNSGKQKPSDDDLRAFVREELARFKAPRYFWWIGGDDQNIPQDWPKTASGKISKPELRDLIAKTMEKSKSKM